MSASTNPSGAFCRSQTIPSCARTRHAGRLGTPSTRIRHCPQLPCRQKGPRGRWYLIDLVKVVTRARKSAAATVSPSCASITSPSKEIRITPRCVQGGGYPPTGDGGGAGGAGSGGSQEGYTPGGLHLKTRSV